MTSGSSVGSGVTSGSSVGSGVTSGSLVGSGVTSGSSVGSGVTSGSSVGSGVTSGSSVGSGVISGSSVESSVSSGSFSISAGSSRITCASPSPISTICPFSSSTSTTVPLPSSAAARSPIEGKISSAPIITNTKAIFLLFSALFFIRFFLHFFMLFMENGSLTFVKLPHKSRQLFSVHIPRTNSGNDFIVLFLHNQLIQLLIASRKPADSGSVFLSFLSVLSDFTVQSKCPLSAAIVQTNGNAAANTFLSGLQKRSGFRSGSLCCCQRKCPHA